jgi:hypothetical protein
VIDPFEIQVTIGFAEVVSQKVEPRIAFEEGGQIIFEL